MIKIAVVVALIWFFLIRDNGGYEPVKPKQKYAPAKAKVSTGPTMPQSYTANATGPTMPQTLNKQKYESQPVQNNNVSLLSGSDLIGVSDMVGGSRRNMTQDIRGEAAMVHINDHPSIGAGVPSIVIGSSVVQDNMNSTLQLSNPWR